MIGCRTVKKSACESAGRVEKDREESRLLERGHSKPASGNAYNGSPERLLTID